MKKLFIFLLILILAFVLYLFLKKDTVEVKINDQTLQVEVADDQKERELGLMNREKLDEDKGMLFVYEKEIKPTFWMKNMLLPLDMIFIGSDKKVNHIEKNIPICTEADSEKCPTYTSPSPTEYILEVNVGYAEKYKIKEGDLVEFKL